MEKFSFQISDSIQTHHSYLKRFRIQYFKWKFKERSTISKLERITDNVQKDQLRFDGISLYLENIDIKSQKLKTYPTYNVHFHFLAAVVSLLIQIASAIISFAQFYNVHCYMKKLNEVIDNHDKNTKPLYKTMQLYFEVYRDIERAIHNLHDEICWSYLDIFSKEKSTQEKWGKLKEAERLRTELVEKVDLYLYQIEVFQTVISSVSVTKYFDYESALIEISEFPKAALHKNKNLPHIRNKIKKASCKNVILDKHRDKSTFNVVKNDKTDEYKLEFIIRDIIKGLEKEALLMEQYNKIYNKNSEFHPIIKGIIKWTIGIINWTIGIIIILSILSILCLLGNIISYCNYHFTVTTKSILHTIIQYFY